MMRVVPAVVLALLVLSGSLSVDPGVEAPAAASVGPTGAASSPLVMPGPTLPASSWGWLRDDGVFVDAEGATAIVEPAPLGWLVHMPGPAYVERMDRHLVTEADAIAEQAAQVEALRSLAPSLDLKGQSVYLWNGVHVDLATADVLRLRASGLRLEPNPEVSVALYQSIPQIGADDVWAMQDGQGRNMTGLGVKIAIIDTGVDYRHNDLGACMAQLSCPLDQHSCPPLLAKICAQAKVWPDPGCFGPGCKVIGGHDYVNADSDPMDDAGHGTHVASIAAGKGHLRGVAPDASILAYKVLNSQGTGSGFHVVSAMNKAVQDGADVISLSLGASNGRPDDSMAVAADNAANQGVVVVAAAGNKGAIGQIDSPGSSRNAITVGAVSITDFRASYSSGGPVKWNNVAIVKPDVVAPGTQICAAQAFAHAAANPGTSQCRDPNVPPPPSGRGGYIRLQGTSMATPHVSGAAALLLQRDPGRTPDQVKALLRTTAMDNVRWSNNQEMVLFQGHGRIDVEDAALYAGLPPIVTLSPIATTGWPGVLTGSASASAPIASWSVAVAPWDAKPQDVRWTTIASGTGLPPAQLTAADAWKHVADGKILVRFTVTDNVGRSGKDYGYGVLAKVTSGSFRNLDVIKGGGQQVVSVAVRPEVTVANVRFEYAKVGTINENPATWTLIGQGSGTSQTWNTAGLAKGGYAVRAVVTYAGSTVTDTLRVWVALDPSLRAGFPVRLPDELCVGTSCKSGGECDGATVCSYGNYNDNGDLVPVVGDTDGDGRREIAVQVVGAPPRLDLVSDSGTVLWSRYQASTRPAVTSAAIMANLDGDNDVEVLAHGFRTTTPKLQIFAYHGDGTLVAGWPAAINGAGMVAMAAGDLGTGQTQVVVRTMENYAASTVTILNGDGTTARSWLLPSTLGIRWYSRLPPVLADVAGDAQPEILVVEKGNPTGSTLFVVDLFAYNADGTLVPGFPKRFDGWADDNLPRVADIDGDGKQDMVVVTQAGIHVVNGLGQPVAGWPVLVTTQFSRQPGIGDLTGDGRPDLVVRVSDPSSNMGVYRHDGVKVASLPATCQGSFGDPAQLVATLDVARGVGVVATGGDVAKCYVTTSGGRLGGADHIVTLNTLHPNFPRPMENGARAMPLHVPLAGATATLVATSATDMVSTTDPPNLNLAYKRRGSLYAWDSPWS